MEIIVGGKKFNEKESFLITKVVMENCEGLQESNEVQRYLKNHSVEEHEDYYTLRNSDFHGKHFRVSKFS